MPFNTAVPVQAGERGTASYFLCFRVQPTERVTLRVDEAAASLSNPELALYTSCQVAPEDVSSSTGASETFAYTNTTAIEQDIVVELFNGDGSGALVDYVLYAIGVMPGSCPGDDPYEPNDQISSATTLNSNRLDDLSAVEGNVDVFRLSVPALETATFTVAHYRGVPLLMDLVDASGNPLGTTMTQAAIPIQQLWRGSLSWTNTQNSTATIFGRVLLQSGAPCQNYAVRGKIDTGVQDDDGGEDNDTCETAATLSLGLTSGLIARGLPFDPDYWSITVPPDADVVIAIDYDWLFDTLDVLLRDGIDASGACDPIGPGNILRFGEPTTTGQYIQFSNSSAAPLRLALLVTSQALPVPRVEYSLTTGIGGDLSFGGRVCEGTPNASGSRAIAVAQGSSLISANNVTLAAYDLPSQSFGYFLTSLGFSVVNNPAGSIGNLCIAGAPIGRFSRPGEILNTGSGSEVSLAIDLNDIPTPTGAVTAMPAEVRYFQYWYRDTFLGVPASNFSSATLVILR
ncbi:MAG: hypothetical protein AAGG01_07235 [Planctomycetota bacterium]